MANEAIPDSSPSPQGSLSDVTQFKKEEQAVTRSVKTIIFSGDIWMIMGAIEGYRENGVFYYDFKNVHFISNSGIAKLIQLIKSFLQEGREIRFVNVNDRIKSRIKSLGLEHIFNCT